MESTSSMAAPLPTVDPATPPKVKITATRVKQALRKVMAAHVLLCDAGLMLDEITVGKPQAGHVPALVSQLEPLANAAALAGVAAVDLEQVLTDLEAN